MLLNIHYHCESWTIKKAESQKIRCFQIVVLEKMLESLLDCKEIQPVHPKGNQPWMFTERMDAEAETPILWPPDAKSWLTGTNPAKEKDWRQEENRAAEDETVRQHHWLNEHESEQTLADSEGSRRVRFCFPTDLPSQSSGCAWAQAQTKEGSQLSISVAHCMSMWDRVLLWVNQPLFCFRWLLPGSWA